MIQIFIDRWPETETDFEGLIGALRFEYRVQAERRLAEEADKSRSFPAIQTLHIHDLGASHRRTLAQ
jgi:hypothetical protein